MLEYTANLFNLKDFP